MSGLQTGRLQPRSQRLIREIVLPLQVALLRREEAFVASRGAFGNLLHESTVGSLRCFLRPLPCTSNAWSSRASPVFDTSSAAFERLSKESFRIVVPDLDSISEIDFSPSSTRSNSDPMNRAECREQHEKELRGAGPCG